MPTSAGELEPVHDFAVRALACGVSVIAVAGDGTKRPAVPVGKWELFQRERASEETLRFWFERNPERGVAVVCGSISGNMECLDFDDPVAFGEWRDLVIQAGLADVLERIEAGYLEHSPNGVHLLYRCGAIDGPLKLAHGAGKVRIETRGEGTYIITAPSCGTVHDSGKPYVQIRGSVESVARITKDERRELHTIARSLDEQEHKRAEFDARRCEPSIPATGGTRPGDDFAAHNSWRDILEPHGWKPIFSNGETTYWRRPGKAKGISATTNYAGAGFFHPFTTSTEFEANRSYGKFSAFAVLNHGGDFRAAASDLRDGGYGDDGEDASLSYPELEALFATPSQPLAEGEDNPLAARTKGLIDRLHSGELAPVPTPWDELNAALRGGYFPGVHFIMGATGVGKTVFTSTIALHAAREGHPVAIAPLEMGAEETVVRVAAESCGVPWAAIMTGTATDAQVKTIKAAVDDILSLPFVIGEIQPKGFEPAHLEALCERAAEMSVGKTPLVIIDFVQLMSAGSGFRSSDLRSQIRDAAYAARASAVAHGCAVIMVSSVGRHGYKIVSGESEALKAVGVGFETECGFSFDGDQPNVNHFLRGAGQLVGLGKESGELEYSATTVSVLVKRPAIRNGVALAIAKQRYLSPTWMPMRFEGGRFIMPTPEEQMAEGRISRAEDTTENGGAIREAILAAVEISPGIKKRDLRERVGAAIRAEGGQAGKTRIENMIADLVFSGEIVVERHGISAQHYLRTNLAESGPELAREIRASGPESKFPIELDSGPRSPLGSAGGEPRGRARKSTGGAFLDDEIKDFVFNNPGRSKAEVETALMARGASRASVRRDMRAMEAKGDLVISGRGRASKVALGNLADNLAGISPDPFCEMGERRDYGLAREIGASGASDDEE
jgi:putative DNA primase/helicase